MSKRSDNLVKISELARLADVPGPTIKHYIREGLLPGPTKRTSRNMAYYDPGIAERIRVIKELQQTRFLPLKVIGQILEPAPSASIRSDLDEVARRQLSALEPAIHAGYDASGMRPTVEAGPQRLSRAELIDSLNITAEDLEELASQGLLDAPDDPSEQVFEGADLTLLQVIDETRRVGLGPLFPIPILTPYTGAIRTLVRAELELFRARVLEGPVPQEVRVSEIAEHASRLSEQLVLAMRRRLMITEMRILGQTTDDEPPISLPHLLDFCYSTTMETALYVFKHHKLVGPGWLLDRCEGLPVPVRMSVLGAGGPLPMGIQCRGVVVVGRPLSHAAFDPKGPDIKEQRIFVRSLIGLAVPYLGIGYGAQLLASALLGKLEETVRDERGASETTLTAEGLADALFTGESATLPVARWPTPAVTIPEKATLLAGTRERPDIFRFGECAWGVLPHLEVTPEGFGDWLGESTAADEESAALVDALQQLRQPRQELAYRVMDRYLGRVTSFLHDEPPLIQIGDHPHGHGD